MVLLSCGPAAAPCKVLFYQWDTKISAYLSCKSANYFGVPRNG